MKSYSRRTPQTEQDILADFAAQFPVCWACGDDGTKHWPFDVQIHHLIGGHGKRRNVPWNLASLCSYCHLAYHSIRVHNHRGELMPDLNLGHLLTLKQEWDFANFDLESLKELRGRRLPELERLPDWYLEERERNGR